MKTLLFIRIITCLLICSQSLFAQENNYEKKIQDIDQRIKTIVEDWNVPGCAIGIIKGDKLIFAKGYGYRDVENKLPVTPNTLFAIGSNTKLFTATVMGFLVEEGKLDWDEPIKTKIPSLQFYNDQLNNSITLRDMLAHRTGLNSPDAVWFYSNFSNHELFEKLKYCEPIYDLRETFKYNNFMYAAMGEIVNVTSGETWENFTKTNILDPLEMKLTNFSIEDMEKTKDYAKPYINNYVDNKIIAIDYNRQTQVIGPAGSINSNINEMANWVICQINRGMFKGKQAISQSIIDETLNPSMITGGLDAKGKEFTCETYGMGRYITTYKGHYITQHGGAIDGFLSKVTIFPNDSLGIIILYNTTQPLRNFLQYEIADIMLGLDKTDWHRKTLDWRANNIIGYKKWMKENKKVIIPDKEPSHKLESYIGVFENEIYGNITIKLVDKQLWFKFYNFNFPLTHVHYDLFETPEHEQYGQYNISFLINLEGQIDQIQMDMDKPDVLFTRREKE